MSTDANPAAAVQALALAQALIRCASVTPADGGALDVLEAALKPLGFVCTRLPFGDEAGRPRIENLYARRGTSSPNICFAGHTDVVPVGQGWSVPPFDGQVVDDHLTGRGAVDMKGAIACFVAAVAALLQDGEPAGSISLLITGDEEGPATDGTQRVLAWLAAHGEHLDACIVGEPTNPGKIGDMVKVGRRGSLNARLRVLGSQGHVAYPHLADNPLPRLVDMLKAITAEPLDGGTERFQPSNLALTSIDVGNMATNIIPGAVEARFNIRFNPQHSFQSLEAWLRERFDAIGGKYELILDPGAECFLTPAGPLTEALERAIRTVTGSAPELSTSGGTSDARFIKDACPVAEFGLVNRTMHKTDERVPLADLDMLTRIYHQLLRDLCKVGHANIH